MPTEIGKIGKNVTISWLGHATFHVVAPAGQRLLLDAWVDTNPLCTPEWRQKAREGLDAILLSHGHADHISDLVPLAQTTEAKIACQYDFGPWLSAKGIGSDRVIGFNKGGTIEVAGVKVTMTAAQHSSTFFEDGKILPMGDPAGFVLRFANDFTIYYTGDTSVTMDMQIIGDLYKPDLVILPIGGFFTMDPRQAAYALKLIRPRYAIGCHWGTYPILTGRPETLRECCKEFDVTTEIIPLQPGESVS